MSAAAARTRTVCPVCAGSDLVPSAVPPGQRCLRCRDCGLIFVAQTDEAAVRALYGAAYYEAYGGVEAAYDADSEARRYEAQQRVDLVRRFATSGRLLEVGAAVGYFLAAARAAGFDVCGIEPAEEQARAARERFGVDVRTGFLEDAELEPASFDVACAWHVLEHIPQPLGALRTLRGVLRAGGTLALEVPNAGSFQAQRLGAAWPHWDPAHHVNHFQLRTLRVALARAGFRVRMAGTVPGSAYAPLGRASPVRAALDFGLEVVQLRSLPRRGHVTRHELLRVVAEAAAP